LRTLEDILASEKPELVDAAKRKAADILDEMESECLLESAGGQVLNSKTHQE